MLWINIAVVNAIRQLDGLQHVLHLLLEAENVSTTLS
jgi:hypothetical protein